MCSNQNGAGDCPRGFGWPRAHEDDAERAVQAGLAIAEAVGRLSIPAGERVGSAGTIGNDVRLHRVAGIARCVRPCALELVATESDGRASVRLILRLDDRPDYEEQMMLDKLEQKLKAELQPSPKAEKPAPPDKPAEKPEKK